MEIITSPNTEDVNLEARIIPSHRDASLFFVSCIDGDTEEAVYMKGGIEYAEALEIARQFVTEEA